MKDNLFGILERVFGKNYQYDLNGEEVFELIEALSRYGALVQRGQRFDRTVEDASIINEMADVVICIYQFMYSRDMMFDNLDKAIQGKINRLCNNESVRTAIAGLSRKVTEATTLTNVHIAEGDFINPL